MSIEGQEFKKVIIPINHMIILGTPEYLQEVKDMIIAFHDELMEQAEQAKILKNWLRKDSLHNIDCEHYSLN